jgi:MFS family permease
MGGRHKVGGSAGAAGSPAGDPPAGQSGAAAALMDATAVRYGPLRLSPGTTRANLTTYYWLALTSIMIFTFVAAGQVTVLSAVLGVDEDQQGRLTGLLGLVAEITLIVTVAVTGAWSDRIGRRPVSVLGFALMGIALLITPFIGNVISLIASRTVAAVGIAMITVMITAVVSDYVRNETRGKANGFLGFCNGIGAVLTFFVLLQLPNLFEESLGFTELGAIRATYVIVAVIALGTALLMRIGLRGGPAVVDAAEPPLKQLLKEGLAAGKTPGLRLSYASAFVARADLALVGAFLILWAKQYGTTELGLGETEALAKGAALVGIANGVALIGAPVIGIISDRLSRVDAVLIALGTAGVGYTATIFVDNPFSPLGYTVAAIIGLGQVSAVIASQVLVAEQAPARIRGSVIGVFALFGGIGIMIALGAGGWLFDVWRPAGPFVLFGVFALLVFAYGLAIRSKIPRNPHDEFSHLDDVSGIPAASDPAQSVPLHAVD